MREITRLSMTALLAAALCASGAWAQAAISADGIVESTAGGFRFPDGAVQATAAVAAAVADSGQLQCFDASGVPRGCAGTGEDGDTMAGVTWPTPRFTDNGDGTVTDHLTRLIWLKDASCSGTLLWQAALTWITSFNAGSTACADYGAGTHSDWRLPNIRELFSLLDFGQTNPPLPMSHPFVNVQTSFYHSSSSNQADPTGAWAVTLTDGNIGTGPNGKAVFSNWVWPVRGGD